MTEPTQDQTGTRTGTQTGTQAGTQTPTQAWPALPVSDWEPTYDTLHMYAQVVGKVPLALRPMMNHWWQVALDLTARGLTTGPLPHGERTFTMELDLLDHLLRIDTSDRDRRTVALGGAVREFYGDVMAALSDLGLEVAIWPHPVEVHDPVPFAEDDVHSTYEGGQAERFFHVLRQVYAVLYEFRSRFTGKASPVHFYWGSFDLTATRYSGRPADPPPDADRIIKLTYTAEQNAVGFWPGGTSLSGTRVEQPIFYAYSYPEPPGVRERPLRPEGAGFDPRLGEFVLPYDDVRAAPDPRGAILDFAQSSFEAGAVLQGWPLVEGLEWAPREEEKEDRDRRPEDQSSADRPAEDESSDQDRDDRGDPPHPGGSASPAQ